MLVELLAVPAAVLEHRAHRGAAVADLADDVQGPFHLALAHRRVGRGGGCLDWERLPGCRASFWSHCVALLVASFPGLPGSSV